MIQTAGTPSSRRLHLNGPDCPPDAVILNAKGLPNPHGKVDGGGEEWERLERVKGFLRDRCPEKVERLVKKGCLAIQGNRPVVVVCLYGRDRSRAIAEMIGEHFSSETVYYEHRESKRK